MVSMVRAEAMMHVPCAFTRSVIDTPPSMCQPLRHPVVRIVIIELKMVQINRSATVRSTKETKPGQPFTCTEEPPLYYLSQGTSPYEIGSPVLPCL